MVSNTDLRGLGIKDCGPHPSDKISECPKAIGLLVHVSRRIGELCLKGTQRILRIIVVLLVLFGWQGIILNEQRMRLCHSHVFNVRSDEAFTSNEGAPPSMLKPPMQVLLR